MARRAAYESSGVGGHLFVRAIFTYCTSLFSRMRESLRMSSQKRIGTALKDVVYTTEAFIV